MKGLWIVARRELAAHRLLLVASALFGGFVAIMPWLAGASRPAELRGAGGLVGVGLWGLALAVGLGVTAVATPLAARRLAFDFRLPLSAAAIWLGRLAAGAFVVLLGAGLTILVPLPFGLDLGGAAGALDVFVERALPGQQELQGLLSLAPLVLLVVFLLAHTAGVAFAGARHWLALDLASVLVAKLGVWLAWRELGLWTAHEARWRLLLAALAIGAAGLLAAAVAAARSGRSEPDRAHRAQSLTLLPCGLLLALLALGYGHWFTHPGIDDLVKARPHRLDDRWSISAGRASGRDKVSFAFLVQDAGSTIVRLGPIPPFIDAMQLAPSGSTLVWFERGDPDSWRLEAWRLDLGAERPAPQRTRLSKEGDFGHWAVSPDGREIVSVRGGSRGRVRLEREELASGGTLGILPVEPCRWADGFVRYLDAGRVEVVCTPRVPNEGEAQHRLIEVELDSRTTVDRGAVRLWPWRGWTLEPVLPPASTDEASPPSPPR